MRIDRRTNWIVSVFGIAALVAVLSPSDVILACPFCSMQGTSLRDRLKDADVAFIAELYDSKPSPNNGETKARILHVLKSNDAIKGKTEIVLPRYIPTAENDKVTYLLYSLVVDGVVDPYLPELVDSSEMTKYLIGAAEQQTKSAADRLGYFFRYLGDTNPTISQDAYTEFAAAPFSEIKECAKHLDADRLIEWIRDPDTQPYRIGLYGCLLGVCNRPADKEVILDILNDPKKRPLSGVDGLLGGLSMLDPKAGTDFVMTVLVDPTNDFNYRYAALRAVRVLLTDIGNVKPDEIWTKMTPGIHIKDMSDLVIDEYRKNKIWTNTPAILALFTDKKYDIQVIKRAVVRYALKCPDPQAATFIDQLRKENPQLVIDVEDILRFEEAQQIRLKAASG